MYDFAHKSLVMKYSVAQPLGYHRLGQEMVIRRLCERVRLKSIFCLQSQDIWLLKLRGQDFKVLNVLFYKYKKIMTGSETFLALQKNETPQQLCEKK